MQVCAGIVPLLWQAHQAAVLAVLLYLLPAMLLALLIRFLSARHPVFFVFTLAGTICHELAHFIVALLTWAQPSGLTVLPRRSGQGWELGSVRLDRVRWYNAAPVALAPLLVIVLPFAVAAWRTRPGSAFGWLDLLLPLLLAPQFLACWPSSTDWKIAARSWPVLVLIGLSWWLLVMFAPGWSDGAAGFVGRHTCALIHP